LIIEDANIYFASNADIRAPYGRGGLFEIFEEEPPNSKVNLI
jgi:hypothetical protein